MYALEITEKFIKQLDLYEYHTVTALAEKIVSFSQTEFFTELIKSVPLPRDTNRLFKIDNEKEALSPNTNNNQSTQPMRRLYTQRTDMKGAESSEYTETYYDDDNKSRYSRLR
jgi:hypothetical protein